MSANQQIILPSNLVFSPLTKLITNGQALCDEYGYSKTDPRNTLLASYYQPVIDEENFSIQNVPLVRASVNTGITGASDMLWSEEPISIKNDARLWKLFSSRQKVYITRSSVYQTGFVFFNQNRNYKLVSAADLVPATFIIRPHEVICRLGEMSDSDNIPSHINTVTIWSPHVKEWGSEKVLVPVYKPEIIAFGTTPSLIPCYLRQLVKNIQSSFGVYILLQDCVKAQDKELETIIQKWYDDGATISILNKIESPKAAMDLYKEAERELVNILYDNTYGPSLEWMKDFYKRFNTMLVDHLQTLY